MRILDTKLGRLLSEDPIKYLINKCDEKSRNLELDQHNKYVKMVKDVHFSNIPNEIRNTEMDFEFNTDFSNLEICSLDRKVKEFLNWYYKNWIKGHYTDIGEFHEQKDIVNFIEKMVSWYEMRYPNFEVNRLMPGSSQENKYVDDILLNKDLDSMEWRDLFDYNAFLQTLSGEEEWYLKNPIFIRSYSMKDVYMGHLYISKDGTVKTNEVRLDVSEHHPNMTLGKSLYITEDFDNLNLLQVKALMEKYNMLNDATEIQKIIDDYQLQIEAKERLLDCVMYRIIERGGNRIGPRRAFLFAKEFNRNIDIPMMYGVDHSDPGLRRFINEYLKAGGSKDLVCCDNYFMRANENEKLSTITMQELIKTTWNDCVTRYTPEEDQLHQRLVDVLSNQLHKKIIYEEQENTLNKKTLITELDEEVINKILELQGLIFDKRQKNLSVEDIIQFLNSAINYRNFQMWLLENEMNEEKLSTNDIFKMFLLETSTDEILTLYDVEQNYNNTNLENVEKQIEIGPVLKKTIK